MPKPKGKRKGAFLFSILGILDPLVGASGPYNLKKDSSHLILLEFYRRGHYVFLSDPTKLFWKNKKLMASVTPVKVHPGPPYFERKSTLNLTTERLDLIFMRKDPPVDDLYLRSTQLLSQTSSRPWIVNSPTSLREWNEKLIILNFPRWIPQTMVTADPKEIEQFAKSMGGQAILKSLTGFAGRGVHRYSPSNRRLVDQLTNHGHAQVMAQAFLKKIHHGEKRIFICGDRILGQVLKVPASNTFLANPDFGAKIYPTSLTARERTLCRNLLPFFRKHDIFFAGIDTIDGHLIEINITSPGLLWEWNEADGKQHEREIVDIFEQRLKRRKL